MKLQDRLKQTRKVRGLWKDDDLPKMATACVVFSFVVLVDYVLMNNCISLCCIIEHFIFSVLY